jgi:hypothetical protein
MTTRIRRYTPLPETIAMTCTLLFYVRRSYERASPCSRTATRRSWACYANARDGLARHYGVTVDVRGSPAPRSDRRRASSRERRHDAPRQERCRSRAERARHRRVPAARNEPLGRVSGRPAARGVPGRPAGVERRSDARARCSSRAVETFARDRVSPARRSATSRSARAFRVSTLYHYYPSKEALYHAVQERVHGQVAELV